MSESYKPLDPRTVEVREVIHVRVGRGRGIEGSIFRIIDQFYALDGQFLAENDPWLHREESKDD